MKSTNTFEYKMNTMTSAFEKINSFVNKRPGLSFADYGDVSAYRSEMNEITKDLHDFRELAILAMRRIDNLNVKLTEYLTKTSGRLTMNAKGELEYTTGQYFPTEYRPAVNRILANLIFADYRDEIEHNSPNPTYKNGNEIRKAISRNVSRRIMKNYFN